MADAAAPSPSPEPVDFKHFRYWAWHHAGPELAEFDASEEACAPFGYLHGQRVKHKKGNYKDGYSTVIGVRAQEGQPELWYDPDGQGQGAVCTRNLKTKEDFEEMFGWEVHGETWVAQPEPGSQGPVPGGVRPPDPT
eukprot:TRINITY_DN58550_c0_g1_i1.p2 TRINITY_DN58550_c0_g1~~TRINITY_DN58550_c0_g1_i1.p2  ORF type:complete len:160 (+),score=68.56 TRINITY_DN58550_c0_g1_i1:71-481(+)